MPEQVDAADFILTTEGLTKEFTGFIAVRNVDLRIRRGTSMP
jgi:branched-chain amino acid transport system ATP-binding protein